MQTSSYLLYEFSTLLENAGGAALESCLEGDVREDRGTVEERRLILVFSED